MVTRLLCEVKAAIPDCLCYKKVGNINPILNYLSYIIPGVLFSRGQANK